MSTLRRYLTRLFLVRFAVVVLAVIGFAAIIDVLDAGDDLVASPDGAAPAIARYLVLRLPMMLAELMPLAALIAGIITVGDLLRHRELVVMWGTGLSNLRIMILFVPIALGLLVAKLALDDQAVPVAAARLRAWGVGEFKHLPSGSEVSSSYWLRDGDDILRVSANAASAGRLLDLTLFRRDPEGILVERIDADRAEPTPDGLRLLNAIRRDVVTRAIEPIPFYDWTGRIDIDRLRLLATPPRELGAARLVEILTRGAYGVRAPEPYITALHTRIAGALVPGLLLLLSIALARRFSRTATIAPILITGITLGFLAIIAAGITTALGEVGLIAPALAVWSPVATLAAVTMAMGVLGRRRLS